MLKELFPTDQNIQWNDKSSEDNKETKKDHVMLDHDIQTNKHKGNHSTKCQQDDTSNGQKWVDFFSNFAIYNGFEKQFQASEGKRQDGG